MLTFPLPPSLGHSLSAPKQRCAAACMRLVVCHHSPSLLAVLVVLTFCAVPAALNKGVHQGAADSYPVDASPVAADRDQGQDGRDNHHPDHADGIAAGRPALAALKTWVRRAVGPGVDQLYRAHHDFFVCSLSLGGASRGALEKVAFYSYERILHSSGRSRPEAFASFSLDFA